MDPPDLDLGGSGKTCVGREIAVDEHPSPVLVDELVPGERVHVHLAEVHVARIERRACGFAVITPSMVITPSISPSQPGCRCAAPRRPRLRPAHRPLYERNNAMPRSEFASRPPYVRGAYPVGSRPASVAALSSATENYAALAGASTAFSAPPGLPRARLGASPATSRPGWHAHCATCRSTSTSPAPSAEAQIKPVALRPERET